jgi:hypothetical protein
METFFCLCWLSLWQYILSRELADFLVMGLGKGISSSFPPLWCSLLYRCDVEIIEYFFGTQPRRRGCSGSDILEYALESYCFIGRTSTVSTHFEPIIPSEQTAKAFFVP